MAPSQQPPLPPPQPRGQLTNIVRIIAIVILSLIVIVGLAVLIIWLVVRPRRPVYSIEEASIHGYNLSNNQLNANFNFVLRAYNPNTRVSIYYDRMEATVSYDEQSMAFNTLSPFFQGHKNVTHLGLNFKAQNVSLYNPVSRDLKLERSSGEVELEVRVKAKIRFKVGVWKSRDRTLRLLCAPLLVHFSSSRGFERTICDIDL